MTYCSTRTDQCLNQPASEKLLLQSNTETQKWKCRERDFGALTPKWDVFMSPSPQASGISVEENAQTIQARGEG